MTVLFMRNAALIMNPLIILMTSPPLSGDMCLYFMPQVNGPLTPEPVGRLRQRQLNIVSSRRVF